MFLTFWIENIKNPFTFKVKTFSPFLFLISVFKRYKAEYSKRDFENIIYEILFQLSIKLFIFLYDEITLNI